MHHARTTATAVAGVVGTIVAALLLTGCTAFGGDDTVPTPTRTASADAQTSVDGDAGPTATATPTQQAVPTGTVVAETDAVSKSGATSMHVRVVANEDGGYDAQFSDYRTTEPQPMTVEFRRSASYGDPRDSAIGQVTWTKDTNAPAGVGLSQAGQYPDWLHVVVLVPASSPEGQSDADRPWVGTVLALGTLQWKLPQPYPDLRVTAGADRPGAYGAVSDRDGRPATYRVVQGDETATVAERFGITQDELQWLNPTLTLTGSELYEGSALNLDPAAR